MKENLLPRYLTISEWTLYSYPHYYQFPPHIQDTRLRSDEHTQVNGSLSEGVFPLDNISCLELVTRGNTVWHGSSFCPWPGLCSFIINTMKGGPEPSISKICTLWKSVWNISANYVLVPVRFILNWNIGKNSWSFHQLILAGKGDGNTRCSC